jgi:hypothetical protein
MAEEEEDEGRDFGWMDTRKNSMIKDARHDE